MARRKQRKKNCAEISKNVRRRTFHLGLWLKILAELQPIVFFLIFNEFDLNQILSSNSCFCWVYLLLINRFFRCQLEFHLSTGFFLQNHSVIEFDFRINVKKFNFKQIFLLIINIINKLISFHISADIKSYCSIKSLIVKMVWN